jgi:hypothetical protein
VSVSFAKWGAVSKASTPAKSRGLVNQRCSRTRVLANNVRQRRQTPDFRTFGRLCWQTEGARFAPRLRPGDYWSQSGDRKDAECVSKPLNQLNQLNNALSCKDAGASGTTRTCDLGIRRPLLYPPELRRQCAGQSIEQCVKIRLGDTTRAKSLPLRQISVMVWSSTHVQHRLEISC